jgi:hypothetical protein
LAASSEPLQHLPGELLSFDRRDFLVADFGENVWAARAECVAEESARNQSNHHSAADDKQDAPEHDLFSRAGCLKKSDHSQNSKRFKLKTRL